MSEHLAPAKTVAFNRRKKPTHVNTKLAHYQKRPWWVPCHPPRRTTLGQAAGLEVKHAELAKFQGTWQLISAETDGKKAPAERVKKIRVVIKGDRHTLRVFKRVKP